MKDIDKDERIAIRQQVVAIDNQITSWVAKLPTAVAPSTTSALAMLSTVDQLRSQWLHDALIDVPFATREAKHQALQAVKPPAIDALANKEDEKAVQTAFTSMTPTASRAFVAHSQTPLWFADDEEILKPGLVLFAGASSTVETIVTVIEMKTAASKGQPTNTARGVRQGVDYAVLALRKQPNRAFMRIVVTNGASFCQIIEVSRTEAQHDYFRYQMLFNGSYNEVARAWIAWLLTCDHAALGYAPFQITINGAAQTLERNNYIGHGQYSYAYELPRLGRHPFVLKYFPDPAMAEHERSIYGAIGQCDTTTQLVADMRPSDPRFIVITPRGFPFDDTDHLLTQQHVDGLFRALRHLHSQGVVHNDI